MVYAAIEFRQYIPSFDLSESMVTSYCLMSGHRQDLV